MEHIESTIKFYTNGIPMWNISLAYISRLKHTNKINLASASFSLPEDGYLEIGNIERQKSRVQVIKHTPKESFKTFQYLDEQIRLGSEVQCHILGQVVVIAANEIIRISKVEEELEIWKL